MSRLVTIAAALLGLAIAGGAAQAADLRFVIQVGPTTLDPHFHNYYANQGMHTNLYEPLLDSDPDGKLVPVLAESWKAVEPTVWEFRLRRNVRFHDGAAFTAQDVVFSIDRVKAIKGSPGSLAGYVRDIAATEIVDDHTLRLKTAAPAPLLPFNLIRLLILDSGNAATTAEIDTGKGAIGTGPYRNVKYVRDNEWRLERNPDWWGPKQPWDNVVFRTVTNEASRLAAFIAGDFDVMQGVPLSNIKQLNEDKRFTVVAKPSLQTFWLAPDSKRDVTPEVTDASGKPLPKNPLKDPRVRRALLMSINRQALVERFLEGYGAVAHQVNAPGADEGVKVPAIPYDPQGAKKLLAEAGYPDGFSLVLTGLTGVIPMDEQICQAIGQFFTRIGVRTKVNSLPPQVAIPRAVRGELSIYFTGSPTPDAYAPLRTTQMTPDAEKGFGSGNRLGYSNPAFDEVMKTVLVTTDDAERVKLLSKGVNLLTEDVSVLPLFHPGYTWATRKGVSYRPAALFMNQAVLAKPE